MPKTKDEKKIEKVEIVIYRFTGRQLFFKVPERWCEECDMTIGLTRSVLRELELENDPRVKLIIKPWVANALEALTTGGWHPPIMLIDQQVFSQGVVPDRARLKRVLMRRLNLSPAPSGNVAIP